MSITELQKILIEIFKDAKLDKTIHGRLPKFHPKRKKLDDGDAKVH